MDQSMDAEPGSPEIAGPRENHLLPFAAGFRTLWYRGICRGPAPGFMEAIPTTNGKISNRILRSLPASEYEELLPHVDLVRLRIGQVLHEPGEEMRYVYFPNHGVLSMLTVLDSGEAVEIATVGNEGMADLSVFLGLKVATSRLINQ